MTPRLTTNYAKNYCNRTLIVKVTVENVVTFWGDTVYIRPLSCCPRGSFSTNFKVLVLVLVLGAQLLVLGSQLLDNNTD